MHGQRRSHTPTRPPCLTVLIGPPFLLFWLLLVAHERAVGVPEFP
jgi:hypothetical protein